jgi:hypothetical protein
MVSGVRAIGATRNPACPTLLLLACGSTESESAQERSIRGWNADLRSGHGREPAPLDRITLTNVRLWPPFDLSIQADDVSLRRARPTSFSDASRSFADPFEKIGRAMSPFLKPVKSGRFYVAALEVGRAEFSARERAARRAVGGHGTPTNRRSSLPEYAPWPPKRAAVNLRAHLRSVQQSIRNRRKT